MKNKIKTGLSYIFKPLKTYRYSREKVGKSLRLQLILTFGVCTIAGMMVASITQPLFDNWSKAAYISYERGVAEIDETTLYIANRVSEERNENSEKQSMNDIIAEYNERLEGTGVLKVMFVTQDGKVINRTKNVTAETVDLHGIIRQAMKYRERIHQYDRREYFAYFPVTVDNNQSAFVIVSGLPRATVMYYENGDFFSTIAGFASFVFLFYYLTKRKMRRIEEVSDGMLEISKGNLDYRVEEKGNDELASLARNINFMAQELQNKIEEERRAEKTKNELITNVSHDLRTPLTSIMGYLRLLRDDQNVEESKRLDYVQIAFNKSEKLKSLIEDLFEYTKINNDGHRLHRETVCLNEMIEQLTEEWIGDAEKNHIVLRTELPNERINVFIDPDKMVRVFENLLSNAIKYSYSPGEVTVKMNAVDASVVIAVENRGELIPPEELSRLFERFYKVDQSRNSMSSGSGLGLAIAKSIVDLHGGEIWAESDGEQIRFLLKLKRI